MMRGAPLIEAQPFARLPETLYHRGPPSAWTRMTRPGQNLHSFLEGAFFDEAGALWLCDVANGRVLRISDGVWETVHHYDGEPHSMRIAADGRHLTVDYSKGILALSPDGPQTIIAAPADGAFLGLSDMTYGPDGTLWFTDSGRSSLSDPVGGVYALAPDGALRKVLAGIAYPNGIAISPDGAFVYVAATRSNAILRFAANLPAEGPPMLGTFVQLSGGLGPDGLATNPLGWLAIAQAQAGRAYVVDALGDGLAEIRLPEGLWTTSLAFDPDDPKRLFIVEAQHGAVFVAHIPE